jgi:hypothetical protein
LSSRRGDLNEELHKFPSESHAFIFWTFLKKRIDVQYIVVANDSCLGRGIEIYPYSCCEGIEGRGSGYVTTLILNLGVRGRCIVVHCSHFTPGKEPEYPLNRRVNCVRNRYRHFRENKNFLPQS